MPEDNVAGGVQGTEENKPCCKPDAWVLYQYWLKQKRRADRKNDQEFVQESIEEEFTNSPAYQEDAKVNGEKQPLVITREDSKVAEATSLPGTNIYIGDIVEALDEIWLCVDSYIDEYGVTNATLWICNYILRFQNGTPEIFETPVVIDDGSYSKPGEEKIVVVDDTYEVYMSLYKDTKWMYIDKRLCLGHWVDGEQAPIVEACKITWIDVRSRNRGYGSHLLYTRVVGDVYNPEKDNYDERICDFIKGDAEEEPDDPETPPVEEPKKRLIIDGGDTQRIGTKRVYTAKAVDEEGNVADVDFEITWTVPEDKTNYAFTTDAAVCSVQIPFDDDLIGDTITISCSDATGEYEPATKTVGVVTLG